MMRIRSKTAVRQLVKDTTSGLRYHAHSKIDNSLMVWTYMEGLVIVLEYKYDGVKWALQGQVVDGEVVPL
ncbi:hypothetical protein D3C81_1395780 [compost metagenome]